MNNVHTYFLQDSLTGLPTRIQLNLRLTDEWNRHIRPALPLSIVLIEVDDFDDFLYRQGSSQSNRALSAIGHGMRDALYRETDFLAHAERRRFVAILPNTGAVAAQSVGERLCQTVAELRIPFGRDANEILGVSIGTATLVPRSGLAADELLSEAESALQRAQAAIHTA